MSRLHRSVGVILLTSALCLGVSAGPVMADDTGGPPPTTTVEPAGQPATPAPTIPAPTTSAPASQPTTEPPPAPEPTTPAHPTGSVQPTTTAEPSEPEVTPPEPTSSEQSTPAPNPAAEEENKADLQLSVWFDKPSYMGDEVVAAQARVTNTGTAPANQAKLTSTGNLDSHTWSPFFPLGVLIEPGQTMEFRLTGRPTAIEDVLHLVVKVQDLSGEEDANPADNTVTATVPLTFVYGSLRGTVYGDSNGSNTMEPGEALAGMAVTVIGGSPTISRITTTDSSGRFVFLNLPRGSYSTWFNDAQWYVAMQYAQVDGTEDPDLLFRGVGAVDSALSISTRFTQLTYRLNDLAHVKMTLTNNGKHSLTNLTATTWSVGLASVDTAPLSGSGLSLPAGATRTVDITARVNDEAATVGYIRIHFAVGAPPYSNGYVESEAAARVPGGVAPRVVGYLELFLYKPMLGRPVGAPLPGVKVYLRSQLTGKIVASAVTEDTGRFTFFNVPTDLYTFGIVGPWVIYWSSPDFTVRNGETGGDYDSAHYIFVKPGPYQPDPEPQQPPTDQPAPTPAPGPVDTAPQTKEAGLAWTGANVLWLAVGGLIALTAGAGLILHGRRRSSG